MKIRMPMFTRRQFLKAGAVAGASLILPWGCGSNKNYPSAMPQNITKFLDPLPRPQVLSETDSYVIEMSHFQQQLHSEFPLTNLWGFNGTYPGPTIEARKGVPISVKWVNNLSKTHLLENAYDTNLHGANMGEPHVRAVVHLHGGHVPPESDGYPHDWFTRGQSATVLYPNNQNAATLWYHDHTLGITRLNVYAGLAGFYIIRDEAEDALSLPRGEHEVPLVIQDRSFNDDGSLLYTVRDPAQIPTGTQHPGQWVPEFFGNVILVNGKAWPYLKVEPGKYRFRILNGSQARFFNIKLGGLVFYQIGSEGGLFSKPVQCNSILLAPAERADVIVDFSGVAGETLIMTNDAPDGPFLGGLDPADSADPNSTGQILQIKVMAEGNPDTILIPSTLVPLTRIPESSAVLTRDFVLEEEVDNNDEPIALEINRHDFDDPIEEKPKRGTTEIWRFINTTGDTHPMHVHLVQFQVLDRQTFGSEDFLAAWKSYFKNGGSKPNIEDYLTGAPVTPDPNEMGWKDTVRVNPGEVLRIISVFDDYIGKYPFHCHILEHEDNAMMSQFEVIQ